MGRLAASPFVGRAPQLEFARTALEAARANRGQSLLLCGEAGIGKSRLADEITALAQAAGFRPIRACCHELDGAPALWPWIQIARTLLPGLDRDRREAYLTSLGEPLVRLLPEFQAKKRPDRVDDDSVDAASPAPIASPGGPMSVPDRYAVFESVVRLLAIATEDSPLLVVIDDLHWADPASVLLARYAVRELRRDPVMFVGLYRDTDVTETDALSRALADLGRESDVHSLEGLHEREIAGLVGHVAGFEVSSVLLAALEAHTGGNPLFMVEILRLLASEDRLGLPSAPSPAPIPLPLTVRHTLERRLEQVTPETRALLHQGAVFGREFDREVLEAALGASVDCGRGLDEALSARLIEPGPDALGRYRFVHDLVRETLDQMLPPAERSRLHRRAAHALRETRSTRLEQHYAALSQHYLVAMLEEGPAGSDREDEPASSRLAYEYSLLGARHAGASFSYELAATLLGRALRALDYEASGSSAAGAESGALDPSGGERVAKTLLERRGEILIQIGNALWQSGLVDEAAEVDREAERLARRLDDPTLLARAAIGLSGRNDLPLDPPAEHVRLLEEALERVPEKEARLRVRLLSHLVRATSYGDDRDRLVDLANEAIAIAESTGDASAIFGARESLHYAFLMPEHLEARLAVSAELPELARRAGALRLEAIAWLWRIFDLLQVPDPVETDRAIARLEETSRRLRQPFWDWLSTGVRACLALMEGELQTAERLVFRALEIGQHASSINAMTFFGTQLFHLREEQGRADELLPVMQKIVDERPELKVFQIGVPLIHTLCDRREEAARTFEAVAANDFRDVPHDFHRLPMLSSAATVAAYLGDARRACLIHDELEKLEGHVIMAGVVTYWGGSVDRALGQLEETLGRFEPAERHYARAAEIAGKAGARLHEAHALCDRARILERLGGAEQLESAGRQRGRAALIYEARGIHEPVRTLPQVSVSAIDADLSSIRSRVARSEDAPRLAARFRRLDHHWQIEFRHRQIDLPDAKGLAYLQRLVMNPDEEIHVLDLVASDARPAEPIRAETRPSSSPEGEPTGLVEQALEVVDARALRAYRDRLRELATDRREAEQDGDLSRLAAIDAEHAEIEAELTRVTGLGGRTRRSGGSTERARKAVYNRIRASIKRIDREHPELARHLDRAIQTGTTCAYHPEQPIGWRFD